jgi:anti-sigma B factor antagonist
MSCTATIRNAGDVAIVDVSGKITLGEGAGTLRETIASLLAEGRKKILLNLGDVSYIDSAGLGELVGAFTSVRNRGGSIKLLNVQKKMQDLLQITKLYTVFETYDDEQEALRSFSQQAAQA